MSRCRVSKFKFLKFIFFGPPYCTCLFIKYLQNNLIYRYADHRWDSRYITYYCMWFRLFATAVVPLVALVYFNIKIVLFFRKHNFNKTVNTINASTSTVANGTESQANPNPTSNGHEVVNRLISIDDRNEQANKMNRDKERSLVMIVCCITLVFLLCHLPRYV